MSDLQRTTTVSLEQCILLIDEIWDEIDRIGMIYIKQRSDIKRCRSRLTEFEGYLTLTWTVLSPDDQTYMIDSCQAYLKNLKHDWTRYSLYQNDHIKPNLIFVKHMRHTYLDVILERNIALCHSVSAESRLFIPQTLV